MSVVAAILLLFGGMAGLLGSWNAARPLIDPTKRYSPRWLPAMVVTELSPFWLLVHVAVLAIGLWAGGWSNWGGRVGTVMLALSMLLSVWIVVRSVLAIIELRRMIGGPIHGATGRARLVGLPVTTPPGVREASGIVWWDRLTLDLIRPDDDRRRLPVVVYVHGGGWTGGDPQRQARDVYHTLALDGWATLAIRYPFTPHVTVEQQVATVAAAVRWARTGLGAHGIDATHVVLAGGSAGAHLATTAALAAERDVDTVDACVGLYGVYDMANRNGTRATWTKIRDEVMLARVSDDPDRYDELSPLVNVTDDSPPMLIVHGERDTLVPIGEAEQFVAALHARGRPVEFVRVGGAEHAFDAVSSPVSRTTAALIRDWLRSTVLADEPAGSL
jgi:acetyl esterase/lipase